MNLTVKRSVSIRSNSVRYYLTSAGHKIYREI